MWSGAAIFVLLTVSTNRISAKFFSDGGSFQLPGDSQPVQQEQFVQDPAAAQYYDMELNRDQLSPYQPQQQQPYDDEKLAGIVDELQKMQGAEMPNDEANFQAYQENPYYDINEAPSNFDAEAFKNLKVQEVETKPAAKADEKEKPDQVVEPNQPMTAQKKGQSEFVGFVEPVQAKQLKHVEIMDKRVPMESRNGHPVQLIQSSSNVVFIALVTMCCVVAVVGVVGGAYYYNHVRKSNDNTFDDFTRYSPAGPGKDKKLKKGRTGSGGSVTENGDESLAYKAQLHHYQQTKQKIIGAEEGMAGIPGVEDEDKSDDELEEHNFSVYECPGLAPTGDIEVQNPNFDVKRTSSP